jgi:NADH-quinone oxidoreductase subunit C
MNSTILKLTDQFGGLLAERTADALAVAPENPGTDCAGNGHPAPVLSAPQTAPATSPPAAAAPAASPGPIQSTSRALKGYDFDVVVAPGQVIAAAELLDRQGFALDTITGVDWLAQNEMEVVYDYFHPLEALRVVVRTRLPRIEPELPTISGIFSGANWHERETHDFFGIRFTGHPNLQPLLLPEDAHFHPLRKDYKP